MSAVYKTWLISEHWTATFIISSFPSPLAYFVYFVLLLYSFSRICLFILELIFLCLPIVRRFSCLYGNINGWRAKLDKKLFWSCYSPFTKGIIVFILHLLPYFKVYFSNSKFSAWMDSCWFSAVLYYELLGPLLTIVCTAESWAVAAPPIKHRHNEERTRR